MEVKKKYLFFFVIFFFWFFSLITFFFASPSPPNPPTSTSSSSSLFSPLYFIKKNGEEKKKKTKENVDYNVNKTIIEENNDDDICVSTECLLYDYGLWEADPIYKIKENVYKNNLILYNNVANIFEQKEQINRKKRRLQNENNHFSAFDPNNTLNEEEKSEKNSVKTKEDKSENEENNNEIKNEEKSILSLSQTYGVVLRALAPARGFSLAPNFHRRESRKTQEKNNKNYELGEEDVNGEEGHEENEEINMKSNNRNYNKVSNNVASINANIISKKTVPTSNGLECIDNPMVEEFGTKCRLIARSFGNKLGCNKKLIDLSPDGYLPPGIPQFSRVADACPQSCELCEECAPGCALWFIGNTMCDQACNNAQCQFDGGDCWSADCVVTEWGEWSDCSVTCNGPGIEKRVRSVKSRSKLGGKPCPKLEEIRNECSEGILCPIDCVVGEWSFWSECSTTCGIGISERTREIIKQPDINGGKRCPELKQVLNCLLDTCKTDCIVTDWGDWTECGKTCGGGAQNRRREISFPPTSGGNECPSLEESKECNTFSCDSGCEVSEWGKWSECSAECGGGKQKRERKIKTQNMQQNDCPPLTQEATCNTHECAIDCETGDWQEWQKCSTSCGEGEAKRHRKILKEKSGMGDSCPEVEQTRKCFLQSCGDECVVSDWSNWSECSATCGEGIKKREREITSYPKGDVKCPNLTEVKACVNRCELQCVIADWSTWSSCDDVCTATNSFSPFQSPENIFSVRTKNVLLYTPNCPDSSTLVESQPCSQLGIVCDVNCVVSDWSVWSSCSEQCGGGNRTRNRLVTRGQSGKGTACPELSQNQPCGTAPCPAKGTKVDCHLGDWGTWSECDATCGGGRQVATREILAYAANGGSPCPETEKFIFGCNNQPCADDCIVTQWSAWSSCSLTCGGGKIERSRSPIRQATNGGKQCPELTQQEDCATYPCPISHGVE